MKKENIKNNPKEIGVVKPIKISDIIIKRELMPREKLDEALVKTYAENIEMLPPITLNQEKILIDGWHRIKAHEMVGETEIEYIIKETKDETELIEEAVKANATFGKQLSMREKEKSAINLFERSDGNPEYKKHLASMLGVHQSTVYSWTKDIAKSKEGLFKEDVIQSYLQAKLTQQQVADKYGVSQKYVSTLIKEIYQILRHEYGIDDIIDDITKETLLEHGHILDFKPYHTNIWEIATTSDFDDDDMCANETALNANILHKYSKPFDTVYMPNETQMIDTCTKWLRRYFTGSELVAEPNMALLEYNQDIENVLTRIGDKMKGGYIIIKCHNIQEDSTAFTMMNKQGLSLLNRIIIPNATASFENGYDSLLVFQV